MSVSAIILCAGRGTRMKDDSKNKVCFDCAGTPVIKRIIDNMKKAGVNRFVIVVGHRADTVMDILSEEEGVVFAYQKEQKGTGHAAKIGLNALSGMGIDGPVIVSMGDKIISSDVISDMIKKSNDADAVWGVQPLERNPHGGRIIEKDGSACGVVEFADAAYYNLFGVSRSEWREKLISLGLSDSKIEKVIRLADKKGIPEKIDICGYSFKADELINTRYANAAFYCFESGSLCEALSNLSGDNAQGEIYLTDTLEYYASRGKVKLTVVENPDDMLTYSTKPELKKISRRFLRSVSDYLSDFSSGAFDNFLQSIYGEEISSQRERYTSILSAFLRKFGDKKIIISRAPGRINLMGRHIDHRGGSVNMMTVSKDTVLAISPRDDDEINISNLNEKYDDRHIGISSLLNLSDNKNWLDYIDSAPIKKYLEDNKGDWSNYFISPILRFAFEGESLCGMDVMMHGDMPSGAGLSSSSSIVVSVAEAIVSLNSLNFSDKEFVELCGESEWFVGSRGGAGDHAAMKCSEKGKIVHLNFKPFEIAGSYPFDEKYTVIVANSGIKSKKSDGSKDKFNEKVASYEFALMFIKKSYPDLGIAEFRDLASLPDDKIYEVLMDLPEAVTRNKIIKSLPEHSETIERIFSTHSDPGEYNLRGVALFGITECKRASLCSKLLEDGDYETLGKLMSISQNGDRIPDRLITYDSLKNAKNSGIDIKTLYGSYGCSTERIDELCDLLDSCNASLGSSMVGAGLGGCVISLVRTEGATEVLETIKKEYYEKYSIPFSAFASAPSYGSFVIY